MTSPSFIPILKPLTRHDVLSDIVRLFSEVKMPVTKYSYGIVSPISPSVHQKIKDEELEFFITRGERISIDELLLMLKRGQEQLIGNLYEAGLFPKNSERPLLYCAALLRYEDNSSYSEIWDKIFTDTSSIETEYLEDIISVCIITGRKSFCRHWVTDIDKYFCSNYGGYKRLLTPENKMFKIPVCPELLPVLRVQRIPTMLQSIIISQMLHEKQYTLLYVCIKHYAMICDLTTRTRISIDAMYEPFLRYVYFAMTVYGYKSEDTARWNNRHKNFLDVFYKTEGRYNGGAAYVPLVESIVKRGVYDIVGYALLTSMRKKKINITNLLPDDIRTRFYELATPITNSTTNSL